ncbi:hypothetical protein AB0D04_24635 [Streptomyces sp. NPDC048483]|uniref:hypothetical protein n=1 Tax=Streptomyces sp. NPDC048483 TaxID=3154927 RepID=UPI0034386F85
MFSEFNRPVLGGLRIGHRVTPGGRGQITTNKEFVISTRSIRCVLAAAGIASLAVSLTACGPKDDKSAAPGSSASANPTDAGKNVGDREAGGKENDNGKAGKTPGQGSQKRNNDSMCFPLKPGHQIIWVRNVEGAMANVIAKQAKKGCLEDGGNDPHFYSYGTLKTYAFDMNAKVTIINDELYNEKALANKPGTRTGIGHVKTCADPNHETWDGGQAPKDDKEYCYGKNFYDVVLDSKGTITEMHEVSS